MENRYLVVLAGVFLQLTLVQACTIGKADCILASPYYTKYQWATCLTNQYIKAKSKQAHRCRNSLAYACYYQCMLEIHELEEGPVYDDCACGRDAVNQSTTPETPVSTLPPLCYSPSGADCNWYSDCLERRYPCRQEQNSYALDYAQIFCKLYEDKYSSFNSKAQEWIDTTRKCLQVSLVPILRPWEHKTCSEIKTIAFNSHTPCYLKPSNTAPSVCDLGFINFWKIFMTVKGALLSETGKTLQQITSVAAQCGYNMVSDSIKAVVMKIDTGLEKLVEEAAETFTREFLRKISDTLNYDRDGIILMGYPDVYNTNRSRRAVNQTEGFQILAYMATREEFDVYTSPGQYPAVNLTEKVEVLVSSVQSGAVRPDLKVGYKFSQFGVCSDFNCSETSTQIEPPAPPVSHALTVATPTLIILISALLIHMF